MVKYELPEPNPMAIMVLPRWTIQMIQREWHHTASAKELERIASEASGTAAWFAWMDAAAVWSRANQPDAQVVALTKATEVGADQTLLAVATMQLANVYQDTNKSEEAIAALEKVINTASAEMKAQACLNLSRMYVDAGDLESQDNFTKFEAPTALQNDILLLQARLDG